MQQLIDAILRDQKFYQLMPNYTVICEKIYQEKNVYKIEAEIISTMSRYKFLNKILEKIVHKNLLHCYVYLDFLPDLYQIKLVVKPKFTNYFVFDGIFYCQPDLTILNHTMDIQYSKTLEIAKSMFDKRIKSTILNQIESDIQSLQTHFKK